MHSIEGKVSHKMHGFFQELKYRWMKIKGLEIQFNWWKDNTCILLSYNSNMNNEVFFCISRVVYASSHLKWIFSCSQERKKGTF